MSHMPPRRVASWAAFLLASASAAPALAEVMDKEPSVASLWTSLALATGGACVLGIVSRWLLPISFFVLTPWTAWCDWHEPYLGADMLREAGAAYGVHVTSVMTAAVAVHLAVGLGMWRLRRGSSRWATLPPRPLTDALFASLLLALVLWCGASGITSDALRVSPPVLLALAASFGLWVRAAAAGLWAPRAGAGT
jgi:hypothetical protein